MLFAALVVLGAADVPLPSPPPGMMMVSAAEALDGGALPAALEADDAEVDAVHALEDVTLEPAAQSDVALRLTVARLGLGSLQRDRLEAALDSRESSGEALPFALGPVDDVGTFDVSQVKGEYDIPVEMQPLVAQYIRFFQGPGRAYFRKWMNRSTRYIPLMQPLLEAKGLPRDTVYLAMIESGFATNAKSWARAVGQWQFIAGTAQLFDLRNDFWVDERKDPVKATRAAADYLSLLYEKHGHWYLAWAGYNAGGGTVRRLVQQYGTRDFWELSSRRGFAKETKHYVPKLIACALVARHPQAFGFKPEEFEFEAPLEWDEVPLTQPADLELLATAAGTTADELRLLNPELKQWCTPPATAAQPYLLRVPRGKQEAFTQAWARLGPTERLNFRVHRVAKGDTLSKIAQSYRSAPEAIMRANNLASARVLRLGAELLVPVPSGAVAKGARRDAAIEKQVVRARRSGLWAARPEEEIPAGTGPSAKRATGGSVLVEQVGGKTRVTYGVSRGDTLWSIARRFDVHVEELRGWNESLGAGARGHKVGAALVIYPGKAADLSGPSAKAGPL